MQNLRLAGSGGVKEAELFNLLLKFAGDDTRFNDTNLVVLVNLQDVVQAGACQYQPALYRQGTAGHAAAGASGHHRKVMGAGQTHQRGNLGRGIRKGHDLREEGLSGAVVGITMQILKAGGTVLPANNIGNFFDNIFIHIR